MRKIFLVFSFCMIALPSLAQSFFVNLPDVPVMPGLVEIEERGLSFDKPEGRILVAAALIDDSINDSDVESFYREALPQFGWVFKKPYQYARGQEVLEFSIQQDGSEKFFEITISP